MIIYVLSWILLALGGFLCISGGLGVLRFPDLFSRMHAASVTDSLGALFILGGLTLQSQLDLLVIAKLLLIALFMFFTTPTSSHALAKAALHSGLQPWQRAGQSSSSRGEIQ